MGTSVDLTTMNMNMDLGQTLMVQTSVDLTTMDMDMDMDPGQTLMVQTSVDLTTMDMDLGQTLTVHSSVDLTTTVKLGIFEARRLEIVLISIYQSITKFLI